MCLGVIYVLAQKKMMEAEMIDERLLYFVLGVLWGIALWNVLRVVYRTWKEMD